MTAAAKVRIDIDENPDPAVREMVLAPLRAFNTSRAGPMSARHLAILLRDSPVGEVVGGLWGWSVADWLFVDLLFVPERLRQQGVGASLMRQAEDIARKRNCAGVWLHTGTFQAPGFYEKLGYHRFGEIADFPRGHETFFYSKRLARC